MSMNLKRGRTEGQAHAVRACHLLCLACGNMRAPPQIRPPPPPSSRGKFRNNRWTTSLQGQVVMATLLLGSAVARLGLEPSHPLVPGANTSPSGGCYALDWMSRALLCLTGRLRAERGFQSTGREAVRPAPSTHSQACKASSYFIFCTIGALRCKPTRWGQWIRSRNFMDNVR
jgi:hypothetical protein